MLIIKFVAAAMLTLSTNLQKLPNNLVTVCDLIQDDARLLESILADKKNTAFAEIFAEACSTAAENGIPCQTRSLRSTSSEDTAHFFFTKVFRPHLETAVEELHRRFGARFARAAKLSLIIPINMVQLSISSASDVSKFFGQALKAYQDDMTYPLDCVLA